jgi:hypothetical protein
MKRIFDKRYLNNVISSISLNRQSNLSTFKFFLVFCLSYGIGLIDWTIMSICLGLLLSINIFLQLDINRNIKIYRKQFYIWSNRYA